MNNLLLILLVLLGSIDQNGNVSKFLKGDTIFVVAGVISAIISLFLVWFFNRWLYFSTASKIVLFAFFAITIGYISHVGIETFQQWYCCSHPFGEPMKLNLQTNVQIISLYKTYLPVILR
jgi:hypothetical protein